MNYTTTGFRPNESSGRYGLSWSLNGVGVINLTTNDAVDVTNVRDEPPASVLNGVVNDESMYYTLRNSQKSEYYDGYDTEYDIYNFSFLNHSGRFIISEGDTVFLGNYGLKVIYDAIEGRGFIDQQGIKYYFKLNDSLGTATRGVDCGKGRYRIYPHTWYLTKVIHPNGDFIKLEYDPLYSTYSTGKSETITKYLKMTHMDCFINKQPMIPGDPLPYPTDEHSTCYNYNVSYDFVLKKISTSEGLVVNFGYTARQDVLNEKLLNNISIVDTLSNTMISKVRLGYHTAGLGNFELDDFGNRLSIRNYLTSVEFTSATDSVLHKYKFDYTSYDSESRFSNSLDYWGFYNGEPNTSLIYLTDYKDNSLIYFNTLITNLANREINPNYVKRSLLNKITYPTGGSDSLVYESNDFAYTGWAKKNKRDTTIVIAAEDSLLSPTHFVTFTSQTFTIPPQAKYVRLAGFLQYLNYVPGLPYAFNVVIYRNNMYVANMDFTLNETGVVGDDFMVDLEGDIRLEIQVRGDNLIANLNCTYELYDEVNVAENQLAPGVRVKSVHTYDNLTKTISASKYYSYTFLGNNLSSSAQYNLPDLNNKSRTGDLIKCDPVATYHGIGDYTVDLMKGFVTFSSSPVGPINFYTGRYSLYSSVIISDDSLRRNGFTRQLYLNLADEFPTVVFGNDRISNRLTALPEQQAVLYQEDIFEWASDTAKIVKSTQYEYDFDNRYYAVFNNAVSRVNYHPLDLGLPYTSILQMGDLAGNNYYHFGAEIYKIYKKWYRLYAMVTKDFDRNGVDYSERKDTLIHTNLYNISPDISYSDLGNEIVGTKNTVSEDLFSLSGTPAWLLAHKTNNYNQLPIQTLSIKEIGNIEYVTGGQFFEYDAVLPWNVSKRYSLKLDKPIPIDSLESISVQSSQLKFDSRFTLDESYYYSALQGNKLVGVETSAGYKETLIWGYNNMYPVARIMNVLPSEVNPLLNYSILTSNDSYAIYNHLLSVKSSLIATTTAFMDIYLYDRFKGVKDHYTYNNQHNQYEYDEFNRLSVIKDKDGNVVQKYCYLFNGQQENCTNAGYYYNAAITKNYQKNDCPVGAASSTISYSLPAGILYSVISQEDADAKALSYIDSVGQIYANNNAVCTFYNDALTQSFTKECATGFVGSTHSYTIAAGTYSSTVSKADANSIAQINIVALGQAHANNIGTCTVQCNSSNCVGEGRKCINNVCEYGYFVLDRCAYHPATRQWVEYYYYRFSDNSVSEMYYRVVDECIWDN